MIKKRRHPFLRWSFLRLFVPVPGWLPRRRSAVPLEERAADHVLSTARVGDPAAAIRAIDQFAWTDSFMMNVGDEKGEILDLAVRSKAPRRILELGTYCGYSALRLAVAAPTADIVSIESNPAHAAVAKRIFHHAGVLDRVAVVVGTLGDGGKTVAQLKEEHQAAGSPFDFVFIDHDKERYVLDVELLLREQMLASSAVVVADNVGFPGSPDYEAYMEAEENKRWRTTRHETVVEYQTVLKDLVLISELIER